MTKSLGTDPLTMLRWVQKEKRQYLNEAFFLRNMGSSLSLSYQQRGHFTEDKAKTS